MDLKESGKSCSFTSNSSSMSSGDKKERDVVRCVTKDDTNGLEALAKAHKRMKEDMNKRFFMKLNKL